MDPNALASQISTLDQGYNPTQTYNDITTKLGIPDARTRVQALQSNLLDTQNAIKAVDPNVTARTSGALVTEAQRGALVNQEKAPLNQTYADENQAFGTQNGQLQDLLGQANTQAGLAQTDYQNKRQSLSDQLTAANAQQALQYQKQQDAIANAQSQQKINQAGAATATAPTPSSQQRSSDKGFNFQDANGGAISARLYAQLTGTNFNTLLKKMAAAGDIGAQDVLKNGSNSKYYKAVTWD